ncbi:MAG: hypothetical protein IIA88_00500 [Bacteroidetes bacterium]|nr:hypothetical protein [Bacteroidota bacterium]
MKKTKNNLFIFEAVELRNEYDRHIKLLERLIDYSGTKNDRYFSRDEDENREPVKEFNQKELEKQLKKSQTKRLKLNQEIQITNFNVQIDFNGEKVSLAEALEIRKNLLSDIEAISGRVHDSAYKNIIHKEKRDIVREPRHSFRETYKKYQDTIKSLRNIVTQIHIANHKSTVNFKDE